MMTTETAERKSFDRLPDFYSKYVGRSRVVVSVLETGYNSDSEQYRSGYAHFKKIRLKN